MHFTREQIKIKTVLNLSASKKATIKYLKQFISRIPCANIMYVIQLALSGRGLPTYIAKLEPI